MQDIDLSAPKLYTNREISWLEFNARVLAAARRPELEVLERLKFIAIAASNLDEFYMVRVANLVRETTTKIDPIDESGDARGPGEVLREIGVRAKRASEQTAQVLKDEILPELERAGVRFVEADALDAGQRARIGAYYRREVHPCLTPIAIDPAHPFPHLRNKSLNIALRIEPVGRAKPSRFQAQQEGVRLALVQVPSVLPRFVPFDLEGADYAFMTLESIIAMHSSELFPGHVIVEARPFRVTRAADIEIGEDAAENLLTTIQDELRRRDRGRAVRLEIVEAVSDELLEILRDLLDVEPQHVHRHKGFIVTSALFQVYDSVRAPALKYRPHVPVICAPLRYDPSLFRTLRERDVLLHHPYESFAHVVDLMNHAADDPDVVAIKQTLYRTSGSSPFVRALARAAANGKQVTALVELKARFDEAANIQWARALEEGGVHVVYGLLGLKTHCKLLLVIRREGDNLKRYLHLGTGNYNSTTARLYTDLSLLTARDDMTADAMLLFNVLTGYAELPALARLIVAPFHLREHTMALIDREIAHAEAGRDAHIIAKMNSLVDPDIIRELYRASRAGVKIDLLIRGICCLRPGIKGVSENIRVRCVIDRFLEHARIAWWGNDGAPEVYASSADWMQRNLNRRIEVTYPILDPIHKQRIFDELLGLELSDNTSTWTLQPDGTYTPNSPAKGFEPFRIQTAFAEMAAERNQRVPTTVRREFAARSGTGKLVSPALRAVELQSRRRRNT